MILGRAAEKQKEWGGVAGFLWTGHPLAQTSNDKKLSAPNLFFSN
jgi:hypothetical protein